MTPPDQIDRIIELLGSLVNVALLMVMADVAMWAADRWMESRRK